MPQVWMTYQELGDLAGIGPQEARDFAIARVWGRRRSQDGLTRVRLPQDLVNAYLLSLVQPPQSDLGSKMATILRAALPRKNGEALRLPKTGETLLLPNSSENRSVA